MSLPPSLSQGQRSEVKSGEEEERRGGGREERKRKRRGGEEVREKKFPRKVARSMFRVISSLSVVTFLSHFFESPLKKLVPIDSK